MKKHLSVFNYFPLALALLAVSGTFTAAGQPDEWTAERAEKLWSPMVRPVQHVGIPGYQFQTGVMWDGSMIFGPPPNTPGTELHPAVKQECAPLGNNQLHLSVAYGQPMRFIDRKGTGNPAIRRSLEEGLLPIAHVETAAGDFLWRETVFAHLLDRKPEEGMDPRPDDVLVTHVRFEARNVGKAAGEAHLWLHFGDTSQVRLGYKSAMDTELGKTLPCRFEAPLGIVDGRVRYAIPKPAQGNLVWHDEVPAPEGMKNALAGAIEWKAPLEPGEKAELRLVVPYGLVDRRTAEKLTALDFGRQLDEVRKFWKDLLSRRSRITTPDAFVNDYLAAVAGQMAQQVACRMQTGKVWMYKTSPNYYEHFWPCNQGKALPTFDLRGLTHINRPILRSLVEMQTDDVGGLHLGAMGVKAAARTWKSK